MGSRLKQNPERTFYWFFEATCPVSRDTDPGVQFQFPEDLSDEESCQTLPRFCFPYDIQKVKEGVAVQHFTFVLTDLEGSQRFGFCRLTNVTRTCLCMLSYLPWFEVFYKLLNNLADYLAKGQTNEMKVLLAALYKQPVPLSPGCVTLQMVPYFIAPDPRSLPSIPENRNLTELIVAVDVGNLLQLYASMLFERRILIFASKLSTLTSCVHALSAVLYPMYWQHIFIPVLPPHLLDYCCAPMPYLIGVHTSLSERVRSRGLEEVVILNVDSNTLETPFEDLKRIPSDVMAGLKVCLKRQAVAPGCGVSRAFLNAQALLFGGYRDALQSQEDGELWFSEELFLGHRSSSMRQFLQSAVHLQFFKQFIDSRLDILNKGKEPDDLFEEEIQKCETTAGKSKSYQQLVGNLKKGGGALILNMKSKANIKAKGLTKSGLKNLLIHKAHNEEPTLQRGGSVSHRRAQSDCLQNRLPITQHFGKSRPRRPVHKHIATTGEQDETDAADSWNGAPSEPAVMPEPHTAEEEGEDSLLCDSEEMDLLGEIFDTLSSRSSHDRGLLYGTRSLDLFGLDNHDFIMKRDFPANPSQESLSLSISGSGSLHSWNLETTEEHSDLTEDSDWLSLNASVTEEERMEILSAVHEKLGQSNGQKEDEEKQEEAKVAIDGEGAEDSRNCKEGETEEEKDRVSHEKRVGPGEDSDEREEEESKEEKEFEENQMAEEPEGQEPDRTDEMLKDLKEEQQGGKDQEDSKTTDSLKVIELTPPHPSTGEEQPRQEDPTAAASRSLTADSEPPAGRECRHDEAKDLQEKRQTPPPKVLSAVARFQSQVLRPGFQVKTRAKELAETRRPDEKFWYKDKVQTLSNTSEENQCSEEEEPSLIKVSELKKRFEA